MSENTRLLEVLQINVTNVPTTSKPPQGDYDHKGALWYVVMVVSVYAMAIFFMIVSHVRRRADKREIDREINSYLRSAPVIKEAEERQRRENLKKAMKPFIELALNRRTLGIQTETTLNGELSMSNSFLAAFGVPGNPAYTEHIVFTGNSDIHPGHKPQRKLGRYRPSKRYNSSDSVFMELREVFVVGKNEKSSQCELDETQILRAVSSDTPSPSIGNSLRSSINNLLNILPSRLSIIHQDSLENSDTSSDLNLEPQNRAHKSSSESSLSDRLLEGEFDFHSKSVPTTPKSCRSEKSIPTSNTPKSIHSNKSSLRLDELDNWQLHDNLTKTPSRKSMSNALNHEGQDVGYVPMVCTNMLYMTPTPKPDITKPKNTKQKREQNHNYSNR